MNINFLISAIIFISTSSFANNLELDAEEIFVETNQDITAKNNVEASYLEHELKSNFLKYQKSIGTITAKDKVEYSNTNSGEKIFAEKIHSNLEFTKIEASDATAKLPDDSTIYGQEFIRDDQTIKIKNGGYTKCLICKDGKKSIPEWKISAKNVTYNRDQQNIIFKHAFFNAFNVPIFYVPKFSYPSPEVKKSSGLLSPRFESDNIFGNRLSTPIFINLAPNYDLTYTPTFFKDKNISHNLEARYLDKYSKVKYQIDYVRENNEFKNFLRSESIDIDNGNNQKWLIDGESLSEFKKLSFETDLFLTSDKAFLERYKKDYNKFYNSKISLNQVNLQNEFFINVKSYDELSNSNKLHSYELPNISYSGNNNINKFLYSYNLDYKNLKSDFFATRQKLSYQDNFSKQEIFLQGSILNYGLKNTVRLYHNDDVSDDDYYLGYAPTLHSSLTHPLIKKNKNSKLLLNPTLNFLATPKYVNSNNVSNLDSASVNLNHSNILSDNKIAGSDLFEEGVRFNYGIDKIFSSKNLSIENFIGQAYYFSKQNNIERTSGIKKKYSDIVGQSKISIIDKIYFNYNYKLEQEKLIPYHNQYGAGYNGKKFKTGLSYTKYKYHLIDNSSSKIDYLSANINYDISDSLNIEALHRANLLSEAIDQNSGSIESKIRLNIFTYCVDYQIDFSKNYIKTQNDKTDYSLMFNFVLKGF